MYNTVYELKKENKMKKIFILFTIFTSIAFGGSDKTIVKYDPNSWQNGHFLERTEWGKKVTQSENCQLSKKCKLSIKCQLYVSCSAFRD